MAPMNFNSIIYRVDEYPAHGGSHVLFRKGAESVANWLVETADLISQPVLVSRAPVFQTDDTARRVRK